MSKSITALAGAVAVSLFLGSLVLSDAALSYADSEKVKRKGGNTQARPSESMKPGGKGGVGNPNEKGIVIHGKPGGKGVGNPDEKSLNFTNPGGKAMNMGPGVNLPTGPKSQRVK